MVVNTKESKVVFSAVDRVTSVVNNMSKGLLPFQKRLDSIGRGLKDFGTGAMTKGIVGLTGVALGFAKPAMEFEKSMAQVYKTFDPTKLGISEKSFAKTTMSMASDMGIMANQMASIFENMPLPEILNIEGMTNKDKYKGIIDLSKMVGMAVTTMSLDAGEAGEKIKNIFNVLGGKDINKVIETMNAVNEMGNQFGVTPSQTLEFLTRQGALGIGNTAGLSNLQTTAIGGTMLSVGATPETAKTSFQKMINVGQAYTSATEKQKEAFEKLGTSAVKFAQSWQKAPTDAIIDILNRAKGLKDIEITPVFKELFGVEGSANIKTMMQNVDNLIKKLKLMQDPNAIKDSVLNEFNKLSKTSSFAVDKLKSSFNNIGIMLGNVLLPYITKFSNYTTDLLKKYDKLDQSTKDLLGSTLLGTTASLGLGLAIGGISYAVGGLVTGIRSLSVAYGALSVIGMKPLSMMSKGIGAVSNKVKGIPTFKRVNSGGIDGFTPANDNARQLNLLGKIKDIFDKIGASSGMAKMLGLLTALEVGSFAIGIVSFGAFVGVLSGIALAGVGVYARFKEITAKLSEMGGLFKELFGGEGTIGGIKSVGWAIAEFIGDALVFTLDAINKVIQGFLFMKNLISEGSFSQAFSKTQYQIMRNDKGALKNAGEEANRSMGFNVPDSPLRDAMIDEILKKKTGYTPNIELKVNTVVHKDGTTTVTSKTTEKDTGKTLNTTIKKGVDPVTFGSNSRFGLVGGY